MYTRQLGEWILEVNDENNNPQIHPLLHLEKTHILVQLTVALHTASFSSTTPSTTHMFSTLVTTLIILN